MQLVEEIVRLFAMGETHCDCMMYCCGNIECIDDSPFEITKNVTKKVTMSESSAVTVI